ncbi:MAG: release factor glutamine methyltransferase [Lentimonas sp.]|jgi:release factor glutamine methyltransferase
MSIRELKKEFDTLFIDRQSSLECQFQFKLIIEYIAKIPFSEVLFNQDIVLSNDNLTVYKEFIARLLKGEPLQYIIGETEFFGLTLKVGPQVLIPRPETEELIYWIQDVLKIDTPVVWDICTGSGCISLSLKTIYPKAKIMASDISEGAIEMAKKNGELNKLKVDFFVSDIFSETKPEENFDLIVSNPPYIPNIDKKNMSKNVLDFEPGLALFVENEEPLVFYHRIATIASQKLKKGGLLFFEIHERFEAEMVALLTSLCYSEINVKRDLQGKARMLMARK